MSYLVTNLPQIQCYVRKEYLYDFEKGHGEYEPCYWVSAKSILGKALYIEAYLTEYGALYDKLPLSAFVWDKDVNQNDFLPLDFLQIWDCFSYNITVIEKTILKNIDCQVYMKDKEWHKGYYLFTIDSCHSDPNELNVSLSQTPNEHKSFNILKMDNGQFAAQPNNRVLFYDQSLTPNKLRKPDFKVSTHEFFCENGHKWAADEGYFYEINDKEDEKP